MKKIQFDQNKCNSSIPRNPTTELVSFHSISVSSFISQPLWIKTYAWRHHTITRISVDTLISLNRKLIIEICVVLDACQCVVLITMPHLHYLLIICFIHLSICYQVKLKPEAIILKAMYFLIMNLDMDSSLLLEIESQNLLDIGSIEEIQVGLKSVIVMHDQNLRDSDGASFKIKTVFPDIAIPISKIWRSWHYDVFEIGFPLLLSSSGVVVGAQARLAHWGRVTHICVSILTFTG